MESYKTNIFKDFTSNSIEYESLSFKEKKKKICAEEDGGNNISTFLSKNTDRLKHFKKNLTAPEKEIETKWSIVNKAFEIIINKRKIITSTEYDNFVGQLRNWLKNINSNKFSSHLKKEITFETDINESIMLDIFILEIKFLIKNLLNLNVSKMLKNLSKRHPFINLLRTKYYKSDELKSIFTELFNGDNNHKKELLKILKIDYFQKCINDENFHPDSLTNILSLNQDNLKILDLNNHYLPFNDGGKLLSYSKFLKTLFESETYIEGMMLLMNAQLKNNKFTKEHIKKSMSEIYKYLFHPVVFPNQEVTKLYGMTCINLHIYLSSFVIDNIENEINLGYLAGDKDNERIYKLKNDCLFDIRTGVEFCVLIMTIIHESAHVVRRLIVQPKVYIETEEIDKEVLLKAIIDVTSTENSNSITEIAGSINKGGEMLDYILFGGTLNDFVAEEVQYIFNLNNWTKDLKTFRNTFIPIRHTLELPLILSKTLMFGNPARKGRRKCGNEKSVHY